MLVWGRQDPVLRIPGVDTPYRVQGCLCRLCCRSCRPPCCVPGCEAPPHAERRSAHATLAGLPWGAAPSLLHVAEHWAPAVCAAAPLTNTGAGQGRFLAIAGFGNLPGDVALYDRKADGKFRPMGSARCVALALVSLELISQPDAKVLQCLQVGMPCTLACSSTEMHAFGPDLTRISFCCLVFCFMHALSQSGQPLAEARWQAGWRTA